MKALATRLSSPWATLTGLLAGGLLGLWQPDLCLAMAPLGDLYLALMQMCVLPIIICAVTAGIARIMGTEHAASLPRLALVFVIGLALTAAIAMVAGFLFQPGSGLALDQRVFLAQEMLRREGDGPAGIPSLWALTQLLVPANIVQAAAQGQLLALLLFSLLLGLGLGSVGSDLNSQAIGVLDAFYNALVKVMGWILVGLPFGLLVLMGAHVAQGGIHLFLMLGKLVAVLYGSAILVAAILTLLIAKRSGIPVRTVLTQAREPLLTAFGTSSSIATLPIALRVVERELGMGRQVAQMVLPIGVTLYPLGNVLHVVITSLFVLQLYGLPIGAQASSVVVLGGILVACAMSGAPGAASMALLGMLLTPFGVPVEVAMVLLVALDPVLDPILTLVNVYGNIGAAAMMSAHKGDTHEAPC